MHEVFLRLLRPGIRYTGDGRPRTWLFKIARNLATDRFRRLRAGAELDSEVADDRVVDPVEELNAVQDLARLEAALGALAPAQREILLMKTSLGLSHRDLATELGCSEGAARVRLCRALDCLRQAWTAVGGATR